MARLRIMARDAAPTAAHRYIEQLRSANRLLRCYTQNVDGIQNKVTSDTCDYILELHGKNELKCHRCHLPPAGDLRDLDEQLLSEGVAWCALCVDRGTYIIHPLVQFPNADLLKARQICRRRSGGSVHFRQAAFYPTLFGTRTLGIIAWEVSPSSSYKRRTVTRT